jgi:hypothetical protein
MSEPSVLLETITAAVLDGLALSFAPADADGTGLPTGVVVGVRHDQRGRVHGSTREVGFEELVLSAVPDKVLSEAISDAVAPVVEAALDDLVPHAV